MDIKKLTQEVLLKNMTPEQQMAVLDSVAASVKEAKAVQKLKIAENVDLVLQALKRIEGDMLKRVDSSAEAVETRVKAIKDGKDGKNGIDGRAGKDGIHGKAGQDGRNGKDGINGISGERGQDGISVSDAHIDFDGSLIISLSNGQELNVGEVVPFDVAEKIRIIGNGGGTSQFVIDTLASLQSQIDNFEALPSQTGNTGKFLTTNGTVASWASVAGGLSYQGTWNASTNTPTLVSGAGTNGYYYIVATSGSTNLDGLTDWQIGDWLLFNGANWQKIDQTNLVTSVAGRTGAVTLSNTDISGLGTIATQNANAVAITGGTISGLSSPLPIASGGTNTTATPTMGGVTYGTGTAQSYTATGSSGQFLTSAGAGMPVWSSASALTGAVGYYGAFQDSTTVTATSTSTIYMMNLGTTERQNGISVVSGNRITVANAGLYNLQFSAQFSNPNAAIADVSIWPRINGVDLVNGTGTNGVPAKHGSNNGLQIIGWNAIFDLQAGDYVQLVWRSDEADVQLLTIPPSVSPTIPEAPSLVVTVQAITQIGIGYYGQTSATSTTIGTGSKTFTVGIPATATAFTSGARVRLAYTTTPTNFMEGVITSFSTTSMTVLVDLVGGSGTYATWAVSVAGNQGTGAVTSVTGTAPLVSSGGSTPAISMAAASSGVNGYMTGTYATKLDGIATGATANTGTVTSVGGTGTVNGLSLSGTVTTAGNLTLGGTLDLSSPPVIGGTAPAAITGTVVTGSSIVASNGIMVNSSVINSNYTLNSGNNGGSFGPVTVASGVTVTVASGSTWTIV